MRAGRSGLPVSRCDRPAPGIRTVVFAGGRLRCSLEFKKFLGSFVKAGARSTLSHKIVVADYREHGTRRIRGMHRHIHVFFQQHGFVGSYERPFD